MKSEDKDQQIMKALKNMPKLKDKRDKEDLYEQISLSMDQRRSRIAMSKQTRSERHAQQPKTRKIIPIFSVALVVVIALVMIPSFINNNQQQTTHHDEIELDTSNGANNIAANNDDTSNGGNDQQEVRHTNENDANEESTSEELAQDIAPQYDTDSHVIYSVNENNQVLYAALPENQSQYAIPISIVVPDQEAYNYNEIEAYLSESDWGLEAFPLAGATFDLNENAQEVTVHLLDDFSIGGTSARTHMFTEVLSHMFVPKGIHKVIFSKEVDLGNIGIVNELPLTDHRHLAYKWYQNSEHHGFFVPVPQDHTSVTDAFIDMKNSEEMYHVYATVPQDVNFLLEANGNQLNVTFTNGTTIENTQEYVTMIEAMLLSAKSFGFDAVLFQNVNESIDYYDLSKPVPVPESSNPIIINP